jgi:hypothetical protein
LLRGFVPSFLGVERFCEFIVELPQLFGRKG